MKTPLLYQKEDIKQIDQFQGRVLLGHEMGLGKTLISLWWWQKHPELFPGLVVCPASVKYVWVKEAKENLGIDPLVIEGQFTKQKGRSLKQDSPLVVINYDILTSWIQWLYTYNEHGFRSLFIDECQYMKDPTSKRTKAICNVAKGLRGVIAISGTPLLNRPVELLPVLQLLKPQEFKSGLLFKRRYCSPEMTQWGWNYNGASHLQELYTRIKTTCLIRKRKKDVLKDLPEKVRRIHTLPLSDPSEYELASSSFVRWLRKRKPSEVFKRAMKAESLSRIMSLKKLAAMLKLKALVDWINEWVEEYPDEKLIVFAHHIGMIEALNRRIKVHSEMLYGKTRYKGNVIQKFQETMSTRVLIANHKTGGVGLTLTAASTVVFVELPWSPADILQCEDRVHRLGQQKKTWVWFMVGEDTIEESMCKMLEEKHDILSSVLDGKYKKAGAIDIYQRLLRRLILSQKEGV